MIKVILLIDCASEFDRKLLRGMMKYSKENGSWLFYRMPSNLRYDEGREEWIIKWAKKWKANAVIGRWNEEKSDLLEKLGIPVVLQNNRVRSDIYSNLTGDYEGTGRMAALYFRRKLFTNYAFFGVKDVIWSEERGKGYRDEVLAANGRFYSYEEESSSVDDRRRVIKWLQSLPERTALFCCDDAHALYITETCMMAGIKVPDQIAVLGVDDDELLCGISDPPISSIQLDVEQGGYMACSLLHRQINARSKEPFNICIFPSGVKERSSTASYNISDKHVLKIVRYIDENYNKDLNMDEILQQVPLSRRSIEMHFKKAMGMSVYQYLLSVRVDHFSFLLRTTDRPIVDIAYEVGFRDFTNVSRTFRKFKGCTPLEFRRMHGV